MTLFGKSRADDAALAARYKHLLAVAKSLSSERDIKKVLTVVVDTIVELTGAERAFVWLGGYEDGAVAVARNIDKEHVRKPTDKLSRSILRRAMESSETILTDNASEDQGFLGSQSVGELKLRSVVCTPLSIHGETIGAIYVDHRFHDAEFSEEDIALLAEFRDLASIAIENARLFEENAKQRGRLEELNTRLAKEVAEQNAEMEAYRSRLRSLKPRDKYRYDYSQILGNSPAIREVFSLLDRVIPTSFPVLIEGESGVGKELIARAIHMNGPRGDKPFLTENCGALTETLLESELFGHVKGSFTGADRTRDGLFQRSHGGTLFLDEIGEMSPSMQTKLLRALQEGEVRKVGSAQVERVDVRIISATNRILRDAVDERSFREDLYYRLNVVRILVPPLRERREDIELMLQHFLESACAEAGVSLKSLSSAALRILTSYSWPGNVRELQNEIKRLVALSDDVIGPELLSNLKGRTPMPVGGSKASLGGRALKDLERQAIAETLKMTGGNKAETAKRLGISRRALYDKIDKYEIK
ncbi:MAG: sigma-54-dependent Fis family transcriptional regulator [Planctomycetota bacterium]|nr:sigma-54-dependent Fis family transcriptional regulator [Planctomycetota bacterium]